MSKNWNRAAMRFASARYADRQGMLDVTFENGDHYVIATDMILPFANNAPMRKPATRAANHRAGRAHPDWVRMRIGETGDVLEVPARGTVIEIPWDRIRAVAD